MSGAHDYRPAKVRFATSLKQRVAGFWLSKIEPFAGGPSE
jgi:hypothetical protein